MTSRIAIVIPSYNREGTVAATVASVAKQDLTAISAVILADDCSTDRTVSVAEQAWSGSVALTVLRPTKNRGQFDNVNAVLGSLAKDFDWALILHDDDMATGDWIRAMVERIRSCGPSVATICSSWNQLMPDGVVQPGEQRNGREDEVIPGTAATVRDTVFRGCWWHFSGAAIRLRAFAAVGPFDHSLSYCADWEWLLRCLQKGFEALYVPESLIDYRQHVGSVSSKAVRIHQDLREQITLIERYSAVLSSQDLKRLYRRFGAGVARRAASAAMKGRVGALGHAGRVAVAGASSYWRLAAPSRRSA